MASPLPGWKDLIVCEGTVSDPCGFPQLIELAQVVVHDLMIISSYIVVIALCYVGFKLITAQGNTAEWTKAKSTFENIVWGYVWIIAAWLVVYTITSVLLKDSSFTLLG